MFKMQAVHSCSYCPKYFESELQLNCHSRLRHKLQLSSLMNKLTFSVKQIDNNSHDQIPREQENNNPNSTDNLSLNLAQEKLNSNSQAWLSNGSLLMQVNAYQDLLLADRRLRPTEEEEEDLGLNKVNSVIDDKKHGRGNNGKRRNKKDEEEVNDYSNSLSLSRFKRSRNNKNVCIEKRSPIRLKREDDSKPGSNSISNSKLNIDRIRSRLTALSQILGQLLTSDTKTDCLDGTVEVVDNKSRDNLLKDVIEKLDDPSGCSSSSSSSISGSSIIGDDERYAIKIESTSNDSNVDSPERGHDGTNDKDNDNSTNYNRDNYNYQSGHNEIKGAPKQDKKDCCHCCRCTTLSCKNDLDELESSIDCSLLYNMIKSIKQQTILNEAAEAVELAAKLGSCSVGEETVVDSITGSGRKLNKEKRDGRKSSGKLHFGITIGGNNNNFDSIGNSSSNNNDNKSSGSFSSNNNNTDTNHRLDFSSEVVRQQIERLEIGVQNRSENENEKGSQMRERVQIESQNEQQETTNKENTDEAFCEDFCATDVRPSSSAATATATGSYRSISVTRRNGQELINCQQARDEESEKRRERRKRGVKRKRQWKMVKKRN